MQYCRRGLIGGGASDSVTYTPSVASPYAGRNANSSNGTSCGGWTSNSSGHSGHTVAADGELTHYYNYCNVQRPLACCNSVYREVFSGYTAATYDGAMGGRHNLHLACATEYPGSHACHTAEYSRTHDPAQPPASGAWMDGSAAFTQSVTYAATCASAQFGRSPTSSSGYSCEGWTSNNSGHSGHTVSADGQLGHYYNYCDVQRPVACCE